MLCSAAVSIAASEELRGESSSELQRSQLCSQFQTETSVNYIPEDERLFAFCIFPFLQSYIVQTRKKIAMYFIYTTDIAFYFDPS